MAFSDCRGQCAIELAVEEELAVLRIKAHGIRRQQVDGEIRREARNVLVVEGSGAPIIACPCVRTSPPTLAGRTYDRHWKPYSPGSRNAGMASGTARGEPASLD